MDILTAIKERHSVRRYLDKPVEKEKAEVLQSLIDEINLQTGLHIQLVLNEKNAFTGFMASYGHFENVSNYIVMAAQKGKEREIGYYGEKLVLLAQILGLNTCWVALTFNKKKAQYTLNKGEKLYMVISLGYGQTQGKQHISKPISEISDLNNSSPEWYKNGINAVILAPTAINQQKFYFSLNGDKVESKAYFGPHSAVDLGIAQYHFDIGSGRKNFGLE